MANSGITASVATSAAAFATAARKFHWDATTLGGPTGRFLEWKDWVDAVVTALQAEVGTDAAGALEDLSVSDLTTTGRLAFGGTALNADGTDFVLSAGFGSGAAITTDSVVGTASAFTIGGIEPGSTPAANPTITLTFPTARATAPIGAIVTGWNFNASAGAHSWIVESVSETTLVIVHVGTPVEAEAIGLTCVVIG